VGSFVRRVTTASGATAAQIVHKRGRRVVGIDHVGSAHDEDRLALLVQTAAQRLHGDQHALELDVTPPRPAEPGSPVVEGTGSLILWEALCGLYDARVRRGRRRGVPGAGIGADRRADQQARHRSRAGRARGRLTVAGDVHALPQTRDREGLPIGHRRRLLPARDPVRWAGRGALRRHHPVRRP
jgi:hypothetical protein